MKKKIIFISIILLLCSAFGLYFVFKDDNRLNQYEKEWLSNVTSKVTNIHVVNDENIFGNNGKGLFYTFIKDFQEKYNISLNTITFKSNEVASGALFGVSNNLPEDSFEFYQDHYIYVSKEKEIIPNYQYLNNKTVGILNTNETYLNKYFKNLNIMNKNYNSKEDLVNALDNGEVTSIVVPRIEYINIILEKNYEINYHFSDIPYYYYMNDVSDSRLKSVMKKYFAKWQKEKMKDYLAEEERNEFLKDLKIEEKDLVDIQSRDVKYGLVNNSPYEVLYSGKVGGIVTDYLKEFSKFAKIDIVYSKYKNYKKLNKKLNSNDLSLFINYYTVNNNVNYIPTNINMGYQVYVYEYFKY